MAVADSVGTEGSTNAPNSVVVGDEKSSGDTSSKFFTFLYWAGTLISVACVLVVAEQMHLHHDETHLIAWWTAGMFVAIATILSFVDIYGHITRYNNPELQCYIIRIILMVPIYAIDSFFSLRFAQFELYFDTVRDGYEGYVIYNFLALLIKVLGTDEDAAKAVDDKPEGIPHMFPMCKLRQWRGKEFIRKNKFGALQYLIVQLICTVFVFIMRYLRLYDEGHFNFRHGYVYRMSITNISQCVAMYCLVLFFHGLQEELKSINPFGKLMCVKAVVFFSFWQSIVVAILVKYHVLEGNKHWDRAEVSHAIQNFAICIEMLIAALAHGFIFSYHDFDEAEGVEQPRTPALPSLLNALSVADIYRDIKEMCGCGAHRHKDVEAGAAGSPMQPHLEDERLLDSSVSPRPAYT